MPPNKTQETKRRKIIENSFYCVNLRINIKYVKQHSIHMSYMRNNNNIAVHRQKEKKNNHRDLPQQCDITVCAMRVVTTKLPIRRELVDATFDFSSAYLQGSNLHAARRGAENKTEKSPKARENVRTMEEEPRDEESAL